MKKVDEKTPKATQVRTNVSQAEQKNKELIDKLNAYKINLEEDVRHARVFQDSLAEIEAWLPLAADYISAQQPISTDSETVRKQLQEAQVCLFLNIMLFKKTPKNYRVNIKLFNNLQFLQSPLYSECELISLFVASEIAWIVLWIVLVKKWLLQTVEKISSSFTETKSASSSLVQHMFLYVIWELLTNSLQIAFLIVLLELFNE